MFVLTDTLGIVQCKGSPVVDPFFFSLQRARARVSMSSATCKYNQKVPYLIGEKTWQNRRNLNLSPVVPKKKYFLCKALCKTTAAFSCVVKSAEAFATFLKRSEKNLS